MATDKKKPDGRPLLLLFVIFLCVIALTLTIVYLGHFYHENILFLK